jgi:hypothetical protein
MRAFRLAEWGVGAAPVITRPLSFVWHGVAPWVPLHDTREAFTAEARQNTALFRRHANATNRAAALKKSNASPKEVTTAKSISIELAREIMARRKLINVDPSAWNTHLFDRMLAHEKVHPWASTRELLQTRLSGGDKDKDCQALVVPTLRGRRILCNIFRYHTQVPQSGGSVHIDDLPGAVDRIKAVPAQNLSGAENLTGYYSISSTFPKSGQQMVEDLAAITPPGRMEVTISPIHGFTAAHKREDVFAQSDEDVRRQVLQHLLDAPQDNARDFHTANGAALAQIHVNRDAPAASRDWITVNYFYDRSALAERQEAVRSGALSVSEPLAALSRQGGRYQARPATGERLPLPACGR